MYGYVMIEFEVFDKTTLEAYKKRAPNTIKAFNGNALFEEDKK